MALPYPTKPGDVDHMIANDHALVNRQFEHLEAGRGDRQVLADQVCFEINLHADAEERTFYPELKKQGRDDHAEHLISEHAEVKKLVQTVEGSSPAEPEFEQALTAIIADIRKHALDEETTFLPELREAAGDARMAELGEAFLAAKRTAPTRSHPAAPASGLGHKLADAGAALIDKARDKGGRMKGLATDPSGYLDPQAQALADAFSSLEPMPPEILEPKAARKQPGPDDAVKELLRQQGRPTDPEPVGSVEDIAISTHDGELTVRVYKPTRNQAGLLPVLLWVHGGGWVLYDNDTYDASCRGLCNKTGAIVISPEYRLAPEHPFPTSHQDVASTYRWLTTHAEEIGGDTRRLAIGGESVGGNMAAATSLGLISAGDALPAAQVLVYPITTAEQYGESMIDSADARPLNRPLLSWMAMHAFTGAPESATDPRIDLLGRSADELRALPPTLVITDERDVLRSQGEQFAQNLTDAGVPTTATRYEGVTHEFFGASAVLDKAEQAQQQAADFLLTAWNSTGTGQSAVSEPATTVTLPHGEQTPVGSTRM